MGSLRPVCCTLTACANLKQPENLLSKSFCFTQNLKLNFLFQHSDKVNMVGVLTGISLGILSLFHLWIGFGHLFKVGPAYDPATVLVDEGTPGKGKTPIEHLLAGVFGCWYLSSIAGVLLTLKLGGVEAQAASLICPLFYHVTITLFIAFSPNDVFNGALVTNRQGAVTHGVLALIAIHAYCTIG